MAFGWQEVSIPAIGGSNNLHDFCWAAELSLFCAVGDAGAIYTSPDGLTWTKQTSPEANPWTGVAWNGTTFVAVSSSGTHRVITSTDGATWSTQSASEANTWQSVCWAGSLSLFVAVASSGTHRVMTSPDGATWTNRTAAAALGWHGVCWSADLGLLCAVGSGSTNIVMTSGDGVTWTQRTTPANISTGGTASGSSGLCWSAAVGLFAWVALNTSTSARCVVTSPDGTTWTTQTIPDDSNANGGICAASADVGFILFRQSGTNLVDTSTDGATWTGQDPGVSKLWDCCAWAPALSVVVAWDGYGGRNAILYGVDASLASVSPSTGTKAGGTVITIVGVGLGSVAQGDVLIDGTAALSVTPAADGMSLTCITPAHAVGAVDVTVTGIGTLTGAYTYVSVDKVIPAQGSAQGGQSIIIKGYGFNATSGSPTLGGTAVASYTVDSNTQISAVTAPHQSGLVDVVVPGVDTGTGLYTYTIADQPKLPPIPVFSPVASNGLISPDWTLWLQAVKARVETPITIAPEQVVGGNALTAVNDTNVLATLTGTPSAALLKSVTLTLGWEGFLSVPRGGTGLGSVSAGSLLYASAAQVLSELTIGAANTFLKSDGSVPAWTAGAALTKTDDTNVTLTLGGSASSALVNAASITVGWTGTLASGRGGTGFGTYAKWDLLYASATNVLSKLAASTDGKVLTLVSGVPAWATTTGLGTFNETPSGTINGSNTVFTTAGAYQAGTLRVYLNGVRAKSADYTETTPASGTFTMATAPTTGDLLRVDYGGVGTAIDAGNITSGTLADARLSNTGVSAATYGDSTHIPQIAVDAHGRITSASNVAIGAAGALVLLETHMASASSSLDFTTRNATGQSGATFQSDYDEYLIELVGIVPATNNVGLSLRVTTDGGSTWVATGSYAWTHWVYGPAGTGQTANTAQTEIRLIGFVNVSSTSTFAANGFVRLFNPLSSALHKAVGGQITFWDTGPSLVVDMFSGAYSATTAINGVRVLATSGNLASGTIRIYGVAKS